jgi:hypothetical protein
MLRLGRENALKNEPPLTSADLRILEEAAAKLMAEIRQTADECAAKIESACARALELAEQRAATASEKPNLENLNLQSNIAIASDLVMKEQNPTLGELELMRSLNAFRSSCKPEVAGLDTKKRI